MQTETDQDHNSTGQRKRIVDLLARATSQELDAAYAALEPAPGYTPLRGPETGLVMVRGRMGGGGSAFNLGEASMSRASIQLSDGTVGHAYRLGTDRKAARIAAVFDAIAQSPEGAAMLEKGLLAQITSRLAAQVAQSAAQTAGTRVDFFTLVRGED